MSPSPKHASLAEALADAARLEPRGGWPYVMALREVNGWTSGFYGDEPESVRPTARKKQAVEQPTLFGEKE